VTPSAIFKILHSSMTFRRNTSHIRVI